MELRTTAAQPVRVAARLAFIDNLRMVTICLVVTMHAAVTYSNFGRWYFMEARPTAKLTLLVFGLYQSFLQAWFMGFLFLLAGYFVPASFDRKGPRRFLADRAFRLGVPSLLYMLAIHPFIVWFEMPELRAGRAPHFWASWLHYLARFDFVGESGPLWFTVALLIFCLVYAGVRALAGPPRGEAPALPSHRAVAGLILAIAACTFLMRTVQPIGTAILNMQLCYFSQYAILFAVGILAYRGNWLARLPYRFAMGWFRAAIPLGLALWLGIVAASGVLNSGDDSVLNGGWHWQSAGMALWESFFCVSTCLGLTVLFRERFARQGRLARFLSDNAFAVYVFHTPLLIAVTFALHGWQAPPLAKFAAASALAIAVTFLASGWIFRRIPVLKSAL